MRKFMTKFNGSQVILKTLEEHTPFIFGYIGGAIMPLFDELPKFNLKFVTTRTEQGAGFAAQGYARASNNLGVIVTTSGPGATNAVTPIADAMLDSVPLLLITGQVATSVIGMDAFQESDIVGIMIPVTKHAELVEDASQLQRITKECIEIAMVGRPGPVCMDVPKNIQIAEAEYSNIEINLPGCKVNHAPKDELIEALAKLIAQSKHPVILCGHGITLSKSEEELNMLAEKSQIPVSSTLLGTSGFTNENLNLGMMGMHGTLAANRTIQNADLIIALGMRFDDRVTGKLESYAKGAKVAHIEIDPSEINKNVRADIAINADLKESLLKLNSKLNEKTSAARSNYLKEIANLKKEWENIDCPTIEQGYGKNKKLLMKTIIKKLSDITEGNANIVSDVGQNEMVSARYYDFRKHNSFFASGGAGTMGFSLPASIGVKLARPDEEVWSISGDGGFQMNIQELATIVQENLNIKIAILNNGVLGMVRQWQDLFFNKNFVETTFETPDFVKIAEGYGLPAKKVTKLEEIEDTINWARAIKGPTLIEFICEHDDYIFPMIPSGKGFKDLMLKK